MANNLPPSDSNSQLLEAIKKLTLSITHGTVKAAGSVMSGITDDINVDMTKFAGSIVAGINPILGSFTDKILEKSKGEIKTAATSAYKSLKLGSSHLLDSTKTFFSHQKKENINLHKRLSLSSKTLTDSFKTQGSVNKQLLKETSKSAASSKGIIAAIDLLRKTNIQLMTMVARRLSKTPLTAQEYNLLKPDVSRFPHLATGGIVEKGGLAIVHNNEKITPSRVVDVQTAYLKRIAEATESTDTITNNKFNRKGSFSLEGKQIEKQTLMFGKLIKKFTKDNKLDRTLKTAELSNIAARKSFAESTMIRKMWRGMVTRPGESFAGTEGGQIIEELKELRRSIGGNKKYSLSERLNLTYKNILATMPFMEASANATKWALSKAVSVPKTVIGGSAKAINASLRWASGGSENTGAFMIRGKGLRYGRHVTVKGDPARTTASATVGIYEWTRIYGQQITSQLNKILTKFKLEKEVTYKNEKGFGSKRRSDELKYGAPATGLKYLFTEGKSYIGSKINNIKQKFNKPKKDESNIIQFPTSQSKTNNLLTKLLLFTKINTKANKTDANIEQAQLELDKKQDKRSLWEKAKSGGSRIWKKTKSATEKAEKGANSLFQKAENAGMAIGTVLVQGSLGALIYNSIKKLGTKLATKLLPLVKIGKNLIGPMASLLGKASLVLGSFVAGHQFGKFLYNKFKEVRWFGDSVGEFVWKAVDFVKKLPATIGTSLKTGFDSLMDMLKSLPGKLKNGILDLLEKIPFIKDSIKGLRTLYGDKKDIDPEQLKREKFNSDTQKIIQYARNNPKEWKEHVKKYGKRPNIIQMHNAYDEIIKNQSSSKSKNTKEQNKQITEKQARQKAILESDPKYMELVKHAQAIDKKNKNKEYIYTALADPTGRVGRGIGAAGSVAWEKMKGLYHKKWGNLVTGIPDTLGALAGGIYYGSESPATDMFKNRNNAKTSKAYQKALKRKNELLHGKNSKLSQFSSYVKNTLQSTKDHIVSKGSTLIEISGQWYLLKKNGTQEYIDNHERLKYLKDQVIQGKLILMSAVDGKGGFLIGKGKEWALKLYNQTASKMSMEKGKAIIDTLKSKITDKSFISKLSSKLPFKNQLTNAINFDKIEKIFTDKLGNNTNLQALRLMIENTGGDIFDLVGNNKQANITTKYITDNISAVADQSSKEYAKKIQDKLGSNIYHAVSDQSSKEYVQEVGKKSNNFVQKTFKNAESLVENQKNKFSDANSPLVKAIKYMTDATKQVLANAAQTIVQNNSMHTENNSSVNHTTNHSGSDDISSLYSLSAQQFTIGG